MGKILIVSNRLPLQINIDNNEIKAIPSVGGLATGMKSVYKKYESKWIGWTGITSEELSPKLEKEVERIIAKEKCIPVSLTNDDIEQYYYGFSNKTIWPLFHYFTEFTEFNKEDWLAYVRVNQKFAEVVFKNLEDGDKVWIHDYQLLLLPKLIKDKFPNVSIGFFLHIPFPSFEVFRILPWRNEIIEGMLGADLLGFHIYDYERHFFSTVRRLLGYEINFNEINLNYRIVKADPFPMGIDYQKFNNAAITNMQKSVRDKSEVRQELDRHLLASNDFKFIISIDRLDYTKGIAKRLHAFEYFLQKYPEYKGKITLVMLSVPSRANVPQYQLMKKEIDELVGRINGEYATINWMPVWYFYRSMPFENLIDLYTSCDIALLTPIRDGMNLVAKEYIASRIDKKGVMILSEMAGAAKEMSEAIVINPNNYEEVADAIKQAFEMPEEEQINRNSIMQKRLERYNVEKWADDFVHSLERTERHRNKYIAKKINPAIEKSILEKYNEAKNRVLFLDYDGTLVGFKGKPEQAYPDDELYKILDNIQQKQNTEIVLISGRDRDTFEKWFGNKKYSLITEHGVWIKMHNTEWKAIEQFNIDWKKVIRPIIESYVDRTPGTFLEEKNYSLVWHYRRAELDLGVIRANELKDELTSLIANHDLEILEGKKVIEIKNSGVNKGRAALKALEGKSFDFILGIGDDWTDEYLFEQLPKGAITIKVGLTNTSARFNVETFKKVREILRTISEQK